MSRLFITILNMSFTASIVILAVLLIRILLKRAPRIFSYALWAVVLLRLLCPFSFQADWGIIPAEKLVEVGADTNLWIWENSGQPIEKLWEIYKIENLYAPEGVTEEGNIDFVWHNGKEYSLQKISRFLAETGRVWIKAGKVWAVGAVLLILYGSISYYILIVKLRKCTKSELYQSGAENENFTIVVSDKIRTPFVAGTGMMKLVLFVAPVKPVIYLPEGLDEVQKRLILEHEKIHIRRRDYLIKPIAYLAVCLHWFNPLVWIAFHFMEQDMEISCDEAVLRKVGYENNKEYARTLLAFSGQRGPEFGYPTAFGESSVKTRIKKAVKMKEAKKWVIMAAAAGVLVAAVLLLVNGNLGQQELSETETDVKGIRIEQEENREGGIRGTDTNEEIVYLPEERITVTETAPETLEPSQITDHYFYPADSDLNESQAGTDAGAAGAAEYSQAEYIYEGTDTLSTMKSSVMALAKKYETFGLSAEIYENDYQLYYNGQPIRFFADNANGWNTDKFSGTVFSRPASDQNGYTGVMTQYDENGVVVGIIQLSEEEVNELFGG